MRPVLLAGGLLAACPAFALPVFAQNATPTPPTPAAKTAAPPVYQPYKIGSWTLSGSLRVRGEAWDWFEAPGFDGSYSFAHSLLRVGLAKSSAAADYQVELAQATMLGLPDNAVAPAPQGQLGLGGTYRAVNGGQDGSLFLKQASVRFKNLGDKSNSLKLGRMEFWDGGEAMPKDASLAWLKRERINHRLIGNFGFSAVQRSFDGAQFVHSTPKANFTFLAAQPTEGVFQLNGLGRVAETYLGYAAYTMPRKTSESRLFFLRYNDGRGLAPVDNRPAPVRNTDRGDIEVNTLGGHFIKSFSTSGGKADLLAWGAVQTGDWGSQSHHANAFALEAGYQPKNTKWKPWLRLGYAQSSGDGNPEGALGGRHETFFQVLPTPRIYARFPFFNAMNNEDMFAQAILRPTPKTTLRADVHRLRLNSGADLWYAGGGAFNDGVFGYQGRPAGGSGSLATLVDVSIDHQINPLTSVTLYLGQASGGGVVGNIYPAGKTGRFGFIELSRKF